MAQTNLSAVAQEQNADEQISRLAAASQIYSRAKTVLAAQFLLTVPVGLATAILAAELPALKQWTAAFSFGVALLDALFLERYQSYLKKQGAKIQEAFDCSVLGLPWRKLKVGSPVDTEIVREHGKAYLQRDTNKSLVENWYPPIAFTLPLIHARLICQRANCWWDAELRRKYSLGLKLILIALAVAVIICGLQTNQTLGQLVLSLVAPLSPALLWGTREIRKQAEAAEALNRLRREIEQTWEKILPGALTPEGAQQASIEIQNEIFDRRSRHPLIFNWINRLVRSKHQISMNEKAQELVLEAQKVLGAPTPHKLLT
jgi:hypothetical protein